MGDGTGSPLTIPRQTPLQLRIHETNTTGKASALSRSLPYARALPADPVSKKLKTVHEAHTRTSQRKAAPTTQKREDVATNIRGRMAALGMGVMVDELKTTTTGYPGPGVKRWQMRGTVERARGSRVKARAGDFVEGLVEKG